MNTPVQPPASPAAAVPSPAGAAQTQGSTGTVMQLPPNQPAPEPGQVLSGTVLARAATGLFLLQTEAGQLLLQAAALLSPGASLALQVLQGGARPQVLILPGGNAGGGASAAVAPAATPASVADVTSLTQGGLVTATITRAATISSGPAPATLTLSDGAAGAERSAATGAAPQAGGTAAAPSLTPGSLPQGTTLTLRILSIAPPGASPSLAWAAAAAGQPSIPGIVTGANAAGQPIVQTPLGELTLASNSAPPPGSTLRLELVVAPRLPAGDAAQPLALSQQWETLRAILSGLQRIDPAAAQLVQQAVPQPGPSLTTGMLFFLSALLTGDLRRWLGEDAARALERAGSLADRLGDDFRQMQQLAREPSGQDWRLLLIPLLAEGKPEHLKLFLRDRRGAAGQEGDSESGARFVIEVEFSRLGPFQFDGFTRGKTVDLVVRTRQALSQDMRRDIVAVYADTLSALGFAGELAFQVAPSFVSPLEAVGGPSIGLTV